jgi:ligand-binding sensor domain-containing protein
MFWGKILLISLVIFLKTQILQAQQPIFKHLTIESGLPSNMVYDCFQDSKGFMWFATDAGISKYNGQTFVNFTILDGLKDNENFQIREDSQGRIWFLSFNGGICYFQNGIIHNLDKILQEKKLQFNSTLVTFFEDSKKNIWISSSIKGFLCIKPDFSVNYFPYKRKPCFKILGRKRACLFFYKRRSTYFRHKSERLFNCTAITLF